MDGLLVRFLLVLIVIPLLSVGSKASACPMSMTVENVRVAAIDRAFFLLCGEGLMKASAKGLTLWQISDFPQRDTV